MARSESESTTDGSDSPTDEPPTTRLVCPECRDGKFSWVVKQVNFGEVIEFPGGARDVEMHKYGEITGSDISENGVFCTTCEVEREMSELVPREEGDD